MGAKGTKIPPNSLQVWLNKKGATPGKWPLDNWQLPLPSTQHCEPTNPSVLVDERLNGTPAWYTNWGANTIISTKTPLSYLYKPQTQGLFSMFGGGLMNQFTLLNTECVGANKVLLFATGAAVAIGDVPGGCVDAEEWGNRVYTYFNHLQEQYLSSDLVSYTEMGFDTGAPGGYTDDYTVSAWIRPSWHAVQPNHGAYILATTYLELTPPFLEGSTNMGPLNMLIREGKLTAFLKEFDQVPHYKEYATTAILVAEQWYHTAFTWNSSSQDLTLYIDGVSQSVDKVRDDPYTTHWPPNGGNILISKRAGGIPGTIQDGGMEFSGAIDEVSLWNTNLNAAEVFEIFSSSQYCGPGPNNLNMHSKKNNLVSWWRMGEYGSDYPGTVGGIKDIAEGFSAAKWYQCSLQPDLCFGNDFNIPAGFNKTHGGTHAPSFQSENYKSF